MVRRRHDGALWPREIMARDCGSPSSRQPGSIIHVFLRKHHPNPCKVPHFHAVMVIMYSDFPDVTSVKVVVEERRVSFEVDPASWRTHTYNSLTTVPTSIRPAFASPGTQAELDLVSLIREACATGKEECRFEAPYTDGAGRDKQTILRTVVVHLYYRKSARAPVATAPPPRDRCRDADV